MAMSTGDLFTVLDRVADELSDEDADAVVGLAEIGLGGFCWANPAAENPSSDELLALVAAGQMYQEGRSSLKRRLDYLIVNEHVAEDLLVAGIIHHVTRRMEEFSEDMSKSTSKTRDEYEEHRSRLQDPAEREAQADRINAILPPGAQRVSPDELLEKLDEMLATHAAPVDAEQLREARRRSDTWRTAVRQVLGDDLRL